MQRQFQSRQKNLEAEEQRQKELFEEEEKLKKETARKFAGDRARKVYRLQQEAMAMEVEQKRLSDLEERSEKDRRIREVQVKETIKREQAKLREEQEKAEAALQMMQEGEDKKRVAEANKQKFYQKQMLLFEEEAKQKALFEAEEDEKKITSKTNC